MDSGALRPEDGRLVAAVMDRIDSLAGPAEPPSRIHGDLWAGNVLWSGEAGWLIDPAAHGGHRETDLAMLALFGAPHLDRILAGYNDATPLAAGWRARVPLHQLHPLLVHACLFGASYAERGPVRGPRGPVCLKVPVLPGANRNRSPMRRQIRKCTWGIPGEDEAIVSGNDSRATGDQQGATSGTTSTWALAVAYPVTGQCASSQTVLSLQS